MTKKNGSYTVAKMKELALFLVRVDFFLLGLWVVGALYLLFQLEEAECFIELWATHFFILIHFALAFYLTTLIGDISREERRYERSSLVISRLPYSFYQPLTWLFVSLSSLAGDALLLASGVRLYFLRGERDECREVRIVNITYIAFATINRLLSLLWLVAFSTYNVRHPSPKRE